MDYNKVYTKKVKNSFSNLGSKGEFKIVNIMNLLQDTAVEYAMKLKISSRELAEKNLFWVISRYRIQINFFPELNANLLLNIHRNTHKNLYDLRWFKIETEDHKEIMNALGAWVMIDKKTGTPRHLNTFMSNKMLKENTDDVKNFFYNPEMISEIHNEEHFKIRIHDLDLNKHVNNSSYILWAVEALPETVLKNYTLRKINVVYMKESFYPGIILSRNEILEFNENLHTIHSILDKKTGTELARINMNWEPLS